ncbi:MAG: ABC transporter permease subunit [Eubacteriales bacterium]|nr:ABC transporter permease subunit [Eubacteriales bacterium]
MRADAQKRRARKRNLIYILFLLPGLIYLLINDYIPMFGVFIAFKNIDYGKGIFKSDWIGLQNFRFLFKTKDALIMTRNTLLYNLVFIVLGTVFAIFVAILLCELGEKLSARIFQSALILPYLLSWVIISYVVFAFLSSDTGYVNKAILEPAGKSGVNWYGESFYWIFILIFVYLWKSAGYQSIVYMANIAGIDSSIKEAARIDGANKLQEIRYVVLPLLKPTVIIMTLMAVGRIFYSDFGLFYQVPMDSGALYPTTQTIDTYVYRGLMKLNDIGMASAAGVYQSMVGFVLVLLSNLAVRRIDPDNALF